MNEQLSAAERLAFHLTALEKNGENLVGYVLVTVSQDDIKIASAHADISYGALAVADTRFPKKVREQILEVIHKVASKAIAEIKEGEK